MGLGHVIHRHAAGDLVNIHEKRHCRPPFPVIGNVATTVGHPGQRMNREKCPAWRGRCLGWREECLGWRPDAQPGGLAGRRRPRRDADLGKNRRFAMRPSAEERRAASGAWRARGFRMGRGYLFGEAIQAAI